MKIVSFVNIQHKQWDEFVVSSLDTWFFHYSAWIKIESKYFVNQNLSFAAVEGDQIIAICPAYLRTINRGWEELTIDSGHHRHAGIAFAEKLDDAMSGACAAKVMEHLHVLRREYNADRILLNSHNLALSNINAENRTIPFWIKDYAFQPGMMFTENGEMSCPGFYAVCADQIVDLSLSEEKLFTNAESSFRRAVKKASNGGVILKIADVNAIEDYYDLAKVSAKRTRQTIMSKGYYEELVAAFGGQDKLAILVAYKDDVPVAGLLLILEKMGVNFFGGVSHPDYLQFRVNDFIHWKAICWAKEKGFLRYRLGPVFPSLPSSWNICKVSRFKQKLGGRSVEIIQGSYYSSFEKYKKDAEKVISKLYLTGISNTSSE